MGRYKTTRDCIHAVNGAKDPHDLKRILQKFYPDAFINWEQPVCKIGDILSRTVQGKKTKYLIVKNHENKAGIVYLGSSVLWKNFSDDSVGAYNTVSRIAFSEMTNGLGIEKFKKEKSR
jgi:hypothetical protein